MLNIQSNFSFYDIRNIIEILFSILYLMSLLMHEWVSGCPDYNTFDFLESYEL